MIDSYNFLKAVLDTITEHITVINNRGLILFTNKSWQSFGEQNNCLVTDGWEGINYLEHCTKAAASGDNFGRNAALGIRSVIDGKANNFYFEYPCHSPEEQRWFMMRVEPFTIAKKDYYVITHQNITERKLAEDRVLNLSRFDSLTNIANRRYFNEFINNEWAPLPAT